MKKKTQTHTRLNFSKLHFGPTWVFLGKTPRISIFSNDTTPLLFTLGNILNLRKTYTSGSRENSGQTDREYFKGPSIRE